MAYTKKKSLTNFDHGVKTLEKSNKISSTVRSKPKLDIEQSEEEEESLESGEYDEEEEGEEESDS